jgi:hypothetical protein
MPDLDGELAVDAASLAEAADNFGHIIQRTPVAVLRPGSIHDIRTLVQFANHHHIQVAIAAYDAQRRPPTAGVVLANRQGGPERCLELVEQRAPDGFVDLDAVIMGADLRRSGLTPVRSFH